jgi:hypothetical protein
VSCVDGASARGGAGVRTCLFMTENVAKPYFKIFKICKYRVLCVNGVVA